MISADLEITPGGGGLIIDFQWQAMGMPICQIYAYLRGKHLFKGVAYFIFLLFQPQDSISLSFKQTKKS